MRQSTVIFSALVFVFVVYITLRGQLPAYFSLFSSNKFSAASGGNADKTPSSNNNSVFGPYKDLVPDWIETPIDSVLNMYSTMKG